MSVSTPAGLEMSARRRGPRDARPAPSGTIPVGADPPCDGRHRNFSPRDSRCRPPRITMSRLGSFAFVVAGPDSVHRSDADVQSAALEARETRHAQAVLLRGHSARRPSAQLSAAELGSRVAYPPKRRASAPLSRSKPARRPDRGEPPSDRSAVLLVGFSLLLCAVASEDEHKVSLGRRCNWSLRQVVILEAFRRIDERDGPTRLQLKLGCERHCAGAAVQCSVQPPLL